jgi:hypothetical protein
MGVKMAGLVAGGESSGNFEDQAEAIISAYAEIGIVNDSVRDVLIEHAATELARLSEAAMGLDYEPYVVPSAVTDMSFHNLVSALGGEDDGWLFGSSTNPWRSYTEEELSHPPTAVKPFVSGMVLKDLNGPHPDLFAIGASGAARKNLLRSDIQGLQQGRGERVLIEPLDPAAWVAMNAVRRFKGQPFLEGFNFFDLPPKGSESGLREPFARMNGGYVTLGSRAIDELASLRFSLEDNDTRHSGTRLAVSRKLVSESIPAVIPEYVGELDASVGLDERISHTV